MEPMMISKLIGFAILIFICAVGMTAVQSNPELVWNTTEKSLDNAYINLTNSLHTDNLSPGVDGNIIKIVYKVVDATAYVIIETTKIGARLAIDNPQINFRLIMCLIIFALFLMIALPLIKIAAIIGVLIVDIYHHFKEKRALKKLRENTG